ncbi:sensor histidine kinase [Amycolatopsis cihanbeyliensis]|uniref:histidine kinase n=1 Tax=Amycolatopsis cihanbeyliensis TaxID=1128664 RepID=A0A542DL06_AMYCI|nr:histidine kinase [Amycolatopsis cihanbeyliensis]TQJ03780.1 signal transduction histidine kinase [Amycolatopsis cihanbeyliensis]
MSQSSNRLTRRLTAALQWLGLPGSVLAAALLCDLVIIFSAATDHIGQPSADLVLLPGVLMLSACALWARSQPVTATFAGSAVLFVSSTLIVLGHGAPYTALLSTVSFAETVAGFELVFYCVRTARGGVAFTAVATLVTSCLLAIAMRTEGTFLVRRSDVIQTLVAGLVLLIVAVVTGIQFRKPPARREPGPLASLVRGQWPLIGAFSLLLFLEMYTTASTELRTAPVLLCSMASAGCAVLATRYPMRAGFGLVLSMLLSALVSWQLPGDSYITATGMPISQIAAGGMVVVLLVRYLQPVRAWTVIGLLAGVVALAALLNSRAGLPYPSVDGLRALFVAAVLTLGVAVATGLFLRSRDSERTQAVQAAVTDAQTSERMALARELHDVVAHHVTGIVVQAQAAKMVAQQNPMVVVDALERIETAGTDALTAMRRLVRSMRGDAPAGSSELSEQATTDLAADLRRLVDSAQHGVSVELDLDLPPGLPQEVARSTLRLVQESLTNVGKHAATATMVAVSARVEGGQLHIRVSDDGEHERQRPVGGGEDAAARGASVVGGGGWRDGGYGLVGMRERVELLHGRLSAGPGPDGGWLVEAWLPLEGVE